MIFILFIVLEIFLKKHTENTAVKPTRHNSFILYTVVKSKNYLV